MSIYKPEALKFIKEFNKQILNNATKTKKLMKKYS